MTGIKITQLTENNVVSIREVVSPENVKLGKTVATFTPDGAAEIKKFLSETSGRGGTRQSLHAVIRKIEKAVSTETPKPARKTPRKAPKPVAPVIVEIHENLREMVTDAPNENARNSWLRVLSAKYGVESVRAAFGLTTNFTGK